MKLSARIALLTAVTGSLIALGSLGPKCFAAGEGEFRVENRLFLGDEKEPFSQSCTIFRQDAFYDYLEKPTEVFVFDKTANHIVLLDTNRRLCTEIDLHRVLQFTDELKRRIGEQNDPFVKFLGSPSFENEFDLENGRLTLTNSWMTYHVQTASAPDATAAQRYREFSDWFARLAPIVNPSARPPFPRLLVNAALAERSLVPREVQLTYTPKRGLWPKRISIRSEHHWIDRLDESDLNRVSQTRQFMTIFNPVSLEKYMKSPDKSLD